MIFLDTSFIVSYFNTRDENHSKAVALMKEIGTEKFGMVYITDYIFDESVTVSFVRIKNLTKAIKIGEALRETMKMLEIDKPIFDVAWKIFKTQKRTTFSFTDCTTMALMKERGIKNIATFDKDFQKVKGVNVIS